VEFLEGVRDNGKRKKEKEHLVYWVPFSGRQGSNHPSIQLIKAAKSSQGHPLLPF